MKIKLSYLLIAITVASCSPRITSNITKTYSPIGTTDDVVVLEGIKSIPKQWDKLGNIKIDDTGFTKTSNGTYDKVVGLAKEETWMAGGNIMVITEHYVPDHISTIHRINSLAFRADSASHAYAASQARETATDQDKNKNYVLVSNIPYIKPGFSFRAYTGYGRRINKISPELNAFQRQHIKRIMNGWVYGLDGTFFMESGYGIGFRYQTMFSSSADYAVVEDDEGSYIEGTLKDDVYITFIGPLFSGRSDSKNGKHIFISNVGLGALLYKDNGTFQDYKERISGVTLGYNCNLSYSYLVTDHLSLGADLSYTTGVLKELNYTSGNLTNTVTLDKDHREGLAQIALSVGARYTF